MCTACDEGLNKRRKVGFTYSKRANSCARAIPWCNVLGPTKWAWEILRQKRYHVFLNDKEPGFTLMTVGDAARIHSKILASSYYLPIQMDSINENQMRIDFFKLIGAVSKFEDDDQWYSTLKNFFWNYGATVVAKL